MLKDRLDGAVFCFRFSRLNGYSAYKTIKVCLHGFYVGMHILQLTSKNLISNFIKNNPDKIIKSIEKSNYLIKRLKQGVKHD